MPEVAVVYGSKSDENVMKGALELLEEFGIEYEHRVISAHRQPEETAQFAKTAASHFIQMLSKTEGFPCVVLRFFLVYGPGQNDKRFLPQIIKACLADESFKEILWLPGRALGR